MGSNCSIASGGHVHAPTYTNIDELTDARINWFSLKDSTVPRSITDKGHCSLHIHEKGVSLETKLSANNNNNINSGCEVRQEGIPVEVRAPV